MSLGPSDCANLKANALADQFAKIAHRLTDQGTDLETSYNSSLASVSQVLDAHAL